MQQGQSPHTWASSLSTDADAAARSLYADILYRLDRRIAGWSGFRLSLLGRAHVAKQVLVFMFTFHGTIMPVPADDIRQLCTSVYTLVAANRLAAAGAAHLYTSRVISTMTLQQAGPGTEMKVYWMLRSTKSQGDGPWPLPMADQLTGGKNSCFELGLHWLGHGGRALARTGTGRISKEGAG